MPCGSSKARGVTGPPNPIGDPFWVDYVAHEMGHQFGGNHTFNSVVLNCGGGNRTAPPRTSRAAAPRSWRYAGICGADDLQPNSDAYFHTKTFDQIVTYSTTGGGNACAAITATGNNPPVPTVPPGGFTIPAQTPFALTGSATDADGDALTYNWEEFDLGNAGPPGVSSSPPFFRSWPATSNPTRTFPRLTNLLANTLPKGEVLPNATRALNFRMTVRDSKGGVDYAPMSFNVTTAAGPFLVTAPNSALTWAPGAQTVTWNVANTAGGVVSCANVDILLSTNGGSSFPTMLLASTPNDGSQSVTIPATPTTTARIKVACSTSIFFDISNTNFTISSGMPGPVVATGAASGISPNGATLNGTVSSNGASTTVTFDYGPTASYGASVAAAQSPLASGATNAAVSAVIGGLACNTLYHFRVVGANSNATTNGTDATFTTAACVGVATSTTLQSSANPSIAGASVTFTASVSGTAPTGNVTFTDGGSAIGGCGAVVLTGPGNIRTAACTTSLSTPGTHTIVATYNGDVGNNPSSSSGLAQQVQAAGTSVATIVANPYGTITVQGATLNGNLISNLSTNVVIQLGNIAGTGSNAVQIDFQGGLNVAQGSTLTVRSGGAGQAVVVRNNNANASVIAGTLRAQTGAGAAPFLTVENARGITVAASGVIVGPAGLIVSGLSDWNVGEALINDGTIDGASRLELRGAKIQGGGAFKGNDMMLSTPTVANNPVNGAHFLANGLQLYPGSGSNVNLTLHAYGAAPQVLNAKINGNGSVWMPSAWAPGSTLPPNNAVVPAGGTRAPGVPEPAYGGGSMIVQATGTLTVVKGTTNDFVFPGAIALKAGGALDLNAVVINQGWTVSGKQFQGVFFESPSIVSPAGNIQVLTNSPNWINFSTLPQQHVRTWSLAAASGGGAAYVVADTFAPHQNTYSVSIEAAANGQCWTCLINSTPIDVY